MAARVHLALLLVVCANQSFAQGIMANHPLVGRWVWTLPHNNCTEDHTFTADGRIVGTSGKEEAEDQITEAVPPNERGGYKITARSVRDTGGPDCANSMEDSTGKSWTMYVFFNPSRQMHWRCFDPDGKKCAGPYRRVEH